MHAVSFVGYGVAFLVVVIVAARWIYRHHPALRDLDPPVPRRDKRAGVPAPGPAAD
ncbi:hypothetical protein [Cupriavidus pauculus]|uniref:hypothetical protein n=1 Tax=Cupriavidus pauculus TaxID=82633 RepID=UPI001561B64E|nr:hypothetical protein [Cupriavidus pauculus]